MVGVVSVSVESGEYMVDNRTTSLYVNFDILQYSM